MEPYHPSFQCSGIATKARIGWRGGSCFRLQSFRAEVKQLSRDNHTYTLLGYMEFCTESKAHITSSKERKPPQSVQGKVWLDAAFTVLGGPGWANAMQANTISNRLFRKFLTHRWKFEIEDLLRSRDAKTLG